MEMMMKVQKMMIRQRLSWWQWSQKLGWMCPHLHNIHRLQEQQLRIDSQQKNQIPVLAKLCTKNYSSQSKAKDFSAGKNNCCKGQWPTSLQFYTALWREKKREGASVHLFPGNSCTGVYQQQHSPTILKKQKTFIEHLFLSNSYTGVYLLMMQPVWHCTYCNFVLFRKVFNFDQPHKYFIQLFWRKQSEFWQFILQIYFINDRE